MSFNFYRPLQFCFPASTRALILLLSFAVLSSLFANLQIFNLAVLYTNQDEQRLFISKELISDAGQAKEIPFGTVNWQTTPLIKKTEEERKNIFVNQQQKHFEENKITTEKQQILLNTLNNLTKREETSKIKNKNNDDVFEDFWTENEENNKIGEEEDEGEEKYDDEEEMNLNKIGTIRPKREINKIKNDEHFLLESVGSFPWAQEKIRLMAQSLLFSSPGIAITISHFPSYVILRRFGSHLPIFVVLLFSSIITGGFPFILSLNAPFPLVMFSRILLGICFSPAFTFLGQMSAQWASVGEQQFFILTGFLALLFGPTISWIFTVSFLSFDKYSQILVFGVHGAFGLLLAFVWLILYRDRPQTHKLVNGEELHYIVKKKPRQKHSLLEQNLPNSLVCLLLRSTSAWAVWISSFCFFFAILTLLIFYPIFLHKIIKQILDRGSLAMPFILLFLSFLFSHLIFSFIIHKNKLNNLGQNTLIVRIFNTCSFAFCAIIFLLIAMLPGSISNEQQPFTIKWRFILLSISLFPLGFTSLGFIKSAVISGGIHFTQYIIAHMQIAFGLAYTLIPTILFSNISSSSVLVHWRLLFLSCALLLILGLAIFAILGRGKPTTWAEQWSQEAIGDIPLLFVKFSPHHQPIISSAISPAAVQLASISSEAAAAGAAMSSLHNYYSNSGERL